MKTMFWIGPRGKCDRRITLLRVTSDRWMYGEGWKFSISLHRRWFFWQRDHQELRVTLLGLNFHWRGKWELN